MKKVGILALVLLGMSLKADTRPFLDCSDLDGIYEEETEAFHYEIRNGYTDTQGVVAYSGVEFYTQYPNRFRWDESLQACSSRGFFDAYGCRYPVTIYMRKKTQNDEWVFGMVHPTKISPSYHCSYNGNEDRRWTVIKR